jgi:hypothetical protein
MNTLELKEKLNVIHRKWGLRYSDVVPKDMFKICLYPSSYIVNSQDSGDPGQHWLAFAALSPRRIYFFDSLGKSSEHYGFNIPYTIDVNDRQLQSNYTNTCGEFCLYFLYYTFAGICNTHITELFTNNTTKNDAIVQRFAARLK